MWPIVRCDLDRPMKYKPYMKPVAKKLTISKPEQKRKVAPVDLLPGGFMRISDSRVRKVY